MAAFSWAIGRNLPVCRATIFGAVITVVLVGFALPTALAGHGGSFHGGSYAAWRPAPRYHSPQQYAPQKPAAKKPAHKQYVPPKHVPQKQVAQKHESQKHAPQHHLARVNTFRKSQGTYGPEKSLAKRSMSPKHVASAYKRSRSTLTTAKKRALDHSHSHAPHHAYRHYPRRHYPGWHYSHLRHHHRHHPWWLYVDYYDCDDYWYPGDAYDADAEFQRQTAINGVRAQIAAAEEVLQNAVARQKMAEKDLQEAQRRIAKARVAIQDSGTEQVKSNKTMREIEVRLIAGQEPGSAVVQALAKVEAMRVAFDREIHRVLSLPAHAGSPTSADYAHEIAMLSSAQKETLDKDGLFLEAIGNLKAAMRKAASAQHALFEKDPGWIAARDKAVKARHAQTQAERDLGAVTSAGQLSPKIQLHGAQDLAAQARAVIAAGRAALRSLGASAPATEDETPTTSST